MRQGEKLLAGRTGKGDGPRGQCARARRVVSPRARLRHLLGVLKLDVFKVRVRHQSKSGNSCSLHLLGTCQAMRNLRLFGKIFLLLAGEAAGRLLPVRSLRLPLFLPFFCPPGEGGLASTGASFFRSKLCRSGFSSLRAAHFPQGYGVRVLLPHGLRTFMPGLRKMQGGKESA